MKILYFFKKGKTSRSSKLPLVLLFKLNTRLVVEIKTAQREKTWGVLVIIYKGIKTFLRSLANHGNMSEEYTRTSSFKSQIFHLPRSLNLQKSKRLEYLQAYR